MYRRLLICQQAEIMQQLAQMAASCMPLVEELVETLLAKASTTLRYTPQVLLCVWKVTKFAVLLRNYRLFLIQVNSFLHEDTHFSVLVS